MYLVDIIYHIHYLFKEKVIFLFIIERSNIILKSLKYLIFDIKLLILAFLRSQTMNNLESILRVFVNTF